MAWPLTPLTTYVANNTPAIKAADLNSIQSAVNSAFLGTYSYKAILIDGTGGATATPTSGTIKVSATVAASTVPTTSFSKGELYKDTIVHAWGYFSNNGTVTFKKGYNVSSVTRNSTGVVQINFNVNASDTAYAVIANAGAAHVICYQSAPSTTNCIINTENIVSQTVTDADVMFVVFAN